ncbi:MAG: DNA polymerase [Moraxella sp.]
MQHPNRGVRQAAERAAINAPLQGSAADIIIKLAMIAVNEVLPKTMPKCYLQVHDELVFEADEDKVDEIAKLIKNAMQDVLCQKPLRKKAGMWILPCRLWLKWALAIIGMRRIDFLSLKRKPTDFVGF